ncbi:MAG: cytochrome c [Beijerinckiaceae bacterium]|nr:cytochrome c [Beijerinckiaceae bacterium]
MAFVLLAGAASNAVAVEQAGLVEDGRRIARESCAQCHVVEGAGDSTGKAGPAGRAAPPFAAVARMPSTTSVSLKVFLKTTHGAMPDIILSEAEIDALAAYILSLR